MKRKTKDIRSMFAILLYIFVFSFFFLPAASFAAPPDSPYMPGETLAPSCAPGSSNCTVKTFITSLGSPNQVLMVTPDGTDLGYRSPDSSMVPENGNLYYTDDRVADFLATLINHPNGIAGLDSSGKIPLSLIPDSLVGAVNYHGSWNADANTPTLTSGVGSKGDYYVVGTAGSTTIDGTSDWSLGDWIIFNGTTWEKVANSNAVSSVNGQVGAVSLDLSDLGIDNWTGNSLIDTLGTIASGIWHGTPIDATHGGTGLSSVGTNGQVLKIVGGVPAWGTDLVGSGGSNSYAAGTGIDATSLAADTIAVDEQALDLSQIGGILPVSKGGTGAIDQASALANLLPSATGNAGKVLTTDGTTFSWTTPSTSGVNWGAITGSLSDQTDLSAALSGKESSITAGTTGQYWRGDKTWQTLDKSAVGLGNVDNTSDANKPISTATQTALNLKQNALGFTPLNPSNNLSDIGNAALARNNLLPTQTSNAGKFLSTDGTNMAWTVPGTSWGAITGNLSDQSDLHTALSGKESSITAGTTGQYWRGDKSWQTLDKGAIGLGNVENTALSTWTGSANLTTLGTIATGTWNGSTIGDAYITSAGAWNAKQNALGFTPLNPANNLSDLASASTALSTLLPSQTSNSGKVLTTDGTSASWVTPSSTVAWGSVTGILANQTDLTAALSGKENALTFSTGLTRSANTITINTIQNIAKLSNLTANGFVKTSGGDGTLSIDTNTYLTGNQTITLAGDVSGTGTTAITTIIGPGKVTNAMLAGNIAGSKLVGTDITTVGTITGGTWNATPVSDSYIASAATWNAKQNALGFTPLNPVNNLSDLASVPTARNNLLPVQTSNSGKVLTTDGTNASWTTPSSTTWGSITGTLSSQSDLNTALAGKEPSITVGTTGQYWRGDKSWQTLDKSAVGLGNVDNTSDANKQISTATQTALNLKQNSLGFTPLNPANNLSDVSNVATARASLGLGSLATTNSVAWGSITGTLSNQTDLSTALSGKEPVIVAGTTAQYLRGDKTWQTLNASAVGLGNVENTALSTWSGSTNITTLGTISVGAWNGTAIGIAKGGTGAITKTGGFDALSPLSTLGDTLYGGASGTGTRLAGNTTTTKKFLTQTGDGTNSATPGWNVLASSDIPAINLGTSGAGGVTGTLPIVNGGTGATTLTGAGIPVTSCNDIMNQNGANASIKTLTVPNDGSAHTYSVSGYVNISTLTVLNTVTMQVTFTDETNASRTSTFYSPSAGLLNLNTNAFFPLSDMTIRTKANTAITVKTTTAGVGTQIYDVGTCITQMN